MYRPGYYLVVATEADKRRVVPPLGADPPSRKALLYDLANRLTPVGVEGGALLACKSLSMHVRTRLRRHDVTVGELTSPELVEAVLRAVVELERGGSRRTWSPVLAAAEFIGLRDEGLPDPPCPTYEKDTDYDNRCRRAGHFLKAREGKSITTAKNARLQIDTCLDALLEKIDSFLASRERVRNLFGPQPSGRAATMAGQPVSPSQATSAESHPQDEAPPSKERTSSEPNELPYRFLGISEETAERVLRRIFLPRKYRHLHESQVDRVGWRAIAIRGTIIILLFGATFNAMLFLSSPIHIRVYEWTSAVAIPWFLDAMRDQLNRGMLWWLVGALILLAAVGGVAYFMLMRVAKDAANEQEGEASSS